MNEENKMNIIFDTLQYTKGAELVGIKREHAEYHANQLAKLIDEQLLTKSYLVSELKSSENNIIKWFIGVSFTQIGLILGIISFIIKH